MKIAHIMLEGIHRGITFRDDWTADEMLEFCLNTYGVPFYEVTQYDVTMDYEEETECK